MGETIGVIVNRPAPFWLPSMSERDPETNRSIRAICGKLLLRPGANTISLERWRQTADHPAVKMYVETGVLKTDPPKHEMLERTHAPDPVTGIRDLTVVKATSYITACRDPGQLIAWRDGDTRDGVFKLIDKRLAELEDGGED